MVDNTEAGEQTPFIKKVVEDVKWRVQKERLIWAEMHSEIPKSLARTVELVGGLGLGGTLIVLGEELLKPKGRPLVDFVSSPLSERLVELTGRLDLAGRLGEFTSRAVEILDKIPAAGEKISSLGVIDRYPALTRPFVEVLGRASQLKEPVEEALKSATGIAAELPRFAQRMGEVGTPEQKAIFFSGFVLFTAVTAYGALWHRRAAAVCQERRAGFHQKLIAHLETRHPNEKIPNERTEV